MSGQLFSPLVERALRVSAVCHREQHRKASDLPYITHPMGVAMILARDGFEDEHILAAALLHDVVEDTSCTLEELAAEFPAEVITYVAALTERKRDTGGQKRSWQDRKTEHLEHIAAAPLPARAIALADKLHNLGAMVYDLETGSELWSRFGAPAERIIWYNHSMIAAAAQNDDRLRGLATACRTMLERLESTLESPEI